MGRELDSQVSDAHTAALDHAAEFAATVAEKAAARYRALLNDPGISQRLACEPAFNHGKLFTWAEFLVFREEFRRRFPEAGAETWVNAFCRLFLKNDISMSNLVRAMEPVEGEDLQRLQKPR